MINLLLGIFQGFRLKVSEDLFRRTPPCILFVVNTVGCARSFQDNPDLC